MNAIWSQRLLLDARGGLGEFNTLAVCRKIAPIKTDASGRGCNYFSLDPLCNMLQCPEDIFLATLRAKLRKARETSNLDPENHMKRNLTLLPPSPPLPNGRTESQTLVVAQQKDDLNVVNARDLSRKVRSQLAARLRRHRLQMQARRRQQDAELTVALTTAKREFIDEATKHLLSHLTNLARSICLEVIDREVRADPNIILERVVATMDQLALDVSSQTLLPASFFDSATLIATDSSSTTAPTSPRLRGPAPVIFPTLWRRIPNPAPDLTLGADEARLKIGIGELHLSIHREVHEIFNSLGG